LTIILSDKTYDEEFIKKVEEISGENFHLCMQCGTCSGGCPMTEHMDIPPRKLMIMTHLGLKDKIMESNTPWICATCNTCTIRCPRGLELPKVMEAIRQLSLRGNKNYVEPFELPQDLLAELPQIALVSCFRKHTS
jgi:heterodisulfide reductase subunit C